MTPEQIRTEALKLSTGVLTQVHGSNAHVGAVITLADIFAAYIANGAPKEVPADA